MLATRSTGNRGEEVRKKEERERRGPWTGIRFRLGGPVSRTPVGITGRQPPMGTTCRLPAPSARPANHRISHEPLSFSPPRPGYGVRTRDPLVHAHPCENHGRRGRVRYGQRDWLTCSWERADNVGAGGVQLNDTLWEDVFGDRWLDPNGGLERG